MLEMIENEIGRLSLIQNFLDENDGKRTRYKTAAALVPPKRSRTISSVTTLI